MSFLKGFSDKITNMRKKSKDKKDFFSSLIKAAEDGRLSDDEINEIQARFKELELTVDDLEGIRVQAYNAALHAVKSDAIITAEEEKELEKLQKFLKIPESEIAISKKELSRLRLLTEIQKGNPPYTSVPNVILQKSEAAYWSEPASILEQRVVRRRYEGGSHGVSIRIAKGLSYRVGAHRGQVVTDKEVQAVSSGELIITTKRVIFRGNTKSFNLRLNKLLELKFYSDGVRLTDDKGKPRIVRFSDKSNTDIVNAILAYAINHELNCS